MNFPRAFKLKILAIITLVVLIVAVINCTGDARKLRTLVVTGGHSYDTAEFELMFKQYEDLELEFVIKPRAWKLLAGGENFDVMVFYDMWEEISEAEKEIFLAETEKGTGLVFLHHSLVSHNNWPGYTQIIGGKYYHPKYTQDSSLFSDFKHDIVLDVKVMDSAHPVTSGMAGFSIHDEGYMNTFRIGGLKLLLETDHPFSDRYIGWAHQYRNSRVVYLMGGHDRLAYENDSFRTLIENAVRWTSGE